MLHEQKATSDSIIDDLIKRINYDIALESETKKSKLQSRIMPVFEGESRAKVQTAIAKLSGYLKASDAVEFPRFYERVIAELSQLCISNSKTLSPNSIKDFASDAIQQHLPMKTPIDKTIIVLTDFAKKDADESVKEALSKLIVKLDETPSSAKLKQEIVSLEQVMLQCRNRINELKGPQQDAAIGAGKATVNVFSIWMGSSALFSEDRKLTSAEKAQHIVFYEKVLSNFDVVLRELKDAQKKWPEWERDNLKKPPLPVSERKKEKDRELAEAQTLKETKVSSYVAERRAEKIKEQLLEAKGEALLNVMSDAKAAIVSGVPDEKQRKEVMDISNQLYKLADTLIHFQEEYKKTHKGVFGIGKKDKDSQNIVPDLMKLGEQICRSYSRFDSNFAAQGQALLDQTKKEIATIGLKIKPKSTLEIQFTNLRRDHEIAIPERPGHRLS